MDNQYNFYIPITKTILFQTQDIQLQNQDQIKNQIKQISDELKHLEQEIQEFQDFYFPQTLYQSEDEFNKQIKELDDLSQQYSQQVSHYLKIKNSEKPLQVVKRQNLMILNNYFKNQQISHHIQISQEQELRILVLSDIHIYNQQKDERIEIVQEQQGDMNSYKDITETWQNKYCIQILTQFISLLNDQDKGKIYYLFGNHDSLNYQTKIIQPILNGSIVINNINYIFTSGSSAFIKNQSGSQQFGSVNVIDFGKYEYEQLTKEQIKNQGELYQKQMEIFKQSTNQKEDLHKLCNQFYIENKIKTQFQEQLALNIEKNINKEYKNIILSHQGPFLSLTSVNYRIKKGQMIQNQTGNAAYTDLLYKYSDNILCWIHGHTHFPFIRKDEINGVKIFNVAKFGGGDYGIFTIKGQEFDMKFYKIIEK